MFGFNVLIQEIMQCFSRVFMWQIIVKMLFLLLCVRQIEASAKFTNFVCTSYDPNFTIFEYCYIKAINRTYQYISMRAKLLTVLIDNVTVAFALTKRANGYKPFLYNFTGDVCRFLKQRKNPLYNFFFKSMEGFSNINHTCPYSHYIVIEKLSTYHLNDMFTNLLPMPRGDYSVHSTLLTYNVRRATLNTYVTLS